MGSQVTLARSDAPALPRALFVVALCREDLSLSEGGEALRAELRGLGADPVVLAPRCSRWPPSPGRSGPLTLRVHDEHQQPD